MAHHGLFTVPIGFVLMTCIYYLYLCTVNNRTWYIKLRFCWSVMYWVQWNAAAN